MYFSILHVNSIYNNNINYIFRNKNLALKFAKFVLIRVTYLCLAKSLELYRDMLNTFIHFNIIIMLYT